MNQLLTNNAKEKLELYSNNIIKWNKAYNLISASQSDLWQRHILDSTQLFQYLKDYKTIIDLGSGAGFPAIPCAILSQDGGYNQQYILVESINKKAQFLEDTARILGLKNIKIICNRIESADLPIADVITARAFAKIDEIFNISSKFFDKKTKFILLKGKNLQQEIDYALKNYKFDYTIHDSQTGDGYIIVAENFK